MCKGLFLILTCRQNKHYSVDMSWIPNFLLPKWLLLVSTIATFSAAQSIINHSFNRKVYTKGGASVTPLSARLFGVWNLASAAIRLSCAYDMNNKSLYHLTMFSFVLALAHFVSEVTVFKTATFNSPGIVSPLIVASSSLIFMTAQYSYYLH